MSQSETTICTVCNNALAFHLTDSGVEWRHNITDANDHQPVPERAPEHWIGRCDFCSEPSEYAFPAQDFQMIPESPVAPAQWSHGSWAACATCAMLIETGRWNSLLRRVVTTMNVGAAEEQALKYLYRALRRNITGSAKSLRE